MSGAHPSTLNAEVTDTSKDFPALVTVAESNPFGKWENLTTVLRMGDGTDPLALTIT